MSTRLPKKTLDLKRFMLRQDVLRLYRDIFRTLRKVPDERTRLELRDWARADFRNNMHHEDEFIIKSFLFNGQKSLQDLQKSLSLSTS